MFGPIQGIGPAASPGVATFVEGMKARVPNALLPLEIASGDLVGLARTNPLHYTAAGGLDGLGKEKAPSFEDAMLKAMEGVNSIQNESENLFEQMLVSPDSVDAHEVTISMAEASMSLNIARTVLDRVVRGWQSLINTR
ncbi:MAG: flagellar hook-basal body complex protein FliE [Spirochaetes bacterium]|nr:flagellar hook-basal body complex protein FliE [Spirochaetota bacterium]